MTLAPPNQSEEELRKARNKAEEAFRKQRLEEDPATYHRYLDQYQTDVAEFLELTTDLTRLGVEALNVFTTPRFFEVARYLTGPPTSNDDLQTLAEVESFARSRLQDDAEGVQRLIAVIRATLDRRRFAWLVEDREADERERDSAIIATAALMATRTVETIRRNESKDEQELAVEQALIAGGMKKVDRRNVDTLDDAPAPGHFCRESRLGTRKADFVVQLWDRRILALECKVSNSAVNSIKRLNNDAAAKAVVWKREFGELQVVPAAILSGVYNLRHLIAAQAKSLAIFWEHDLDSMIKWITETKPIAKQ